MSTAKILAELKKLGRPATKKTYLNHGITEPCYGVKVEDMKKIVKRVGKDYELALELYDSGVFDAMYLAGLIADDTKMTKKDLEHWMDAAYCPWLYTYIVPWVAAESPHGWELALKWIESKQETVAVAGWATLGSLAGYLPDSQLDLKKYEQLLGRVAKTIHQSSDRVRLAMNGFVISVGGGIKSLTKLALKTGASIGNVSVDMGGTACKVPGIVEYIGKIDARGSIGKKRKSTKC